MAEPGPSVARHHDAARDPGCLEVDERGQFSQLLGIRRGPVRVMVDTYLT